MKHGKQMFLGIDLGTSAIKMVLIDEQKKVLAQISKEYEAAQPENGFNEIDPTVWFDSMIKGMEEILQGTNKSLLKGIGVTGQMHTLITLNKDGEAIRPAIMWNDMRTSNLIPELRKQMVGFPEGDYLARTISTGSPAANLYWMRINEPEKFNQIKKFLIGPDYLVYCLTGTYGTDYCEASTSCLFQIKERKWSTEMRKLIGLTEEMYPQVRGSALPAGILRKEIAKRLSLEQEICVLTGTGDNLATAISTGCLGRRYPVISLGTSGVFMMPVQNIKLESKGKIILFSFDNQSYSYLLQGAVQSNGSTFDWWVKGILGEKNFTKVDKIVDIDSSSDNGVLFYPHLMGDKTLYADPNIRGAFIGLSAETNRSDMLYAVIEGLCFSFRELAERMDLPLSQFGSVKAVGGGAKSKVWMQTLANVLNISIEQMDGMIGPAFGIALLTAYCCGCFESLEQISEGTVNIKKRFIPQADMVAACERKYRKYLRIQKGLQYIEEEIVL
ncbi:MAG: FGGY family carbohydrate kinase [Lachnospiraceae bacterium]